VPFNSQNTLMQAAIEDLGGRSELTPVPADVVAGLTLPDGEPLPSAMRLWLSVSDRWPSGLPALVDGALPFKTMTQLFEELVTSESAGEAWEGDTRAHMMALAEKWPGYALLLESPQGQDKIYYLGRRSRGGRCAVVALEGERMFLHSPGLAFYVANYSELPSQVGTAFHASAYTAFREVLFGLL